MVLIILSLTLAENMLKGNMVANGCEEIELVDYCYAYICQNQDKY